jgi:hypothetical protein
MPENGKHSMVLSPRNDTRLVMPCREIQWHNWWLRSIRIKS